MFACIHIYYINIYIYIYTYIYIHIYIYFTYTYIYVCKESVSIADMPGRVAYPTKPIVIKRDLYILHL